MTTPPTVILAHDAFLQPTHYAAFTADLHVRGLTEVRIPQLPSTITSPPPPDDAFAQDVAVLHRTVQSCLRSGRDVVVLAHGYGGLPLGDALEGVTTTARPENVRVLGLVWVAAVVGEEGEDARSARKEGLEGVKVEGPLIHATSPRTTLFNTLTDPTALTTALAGVAPQAKSAFTTPVRHASWEHFPCTYVKCLQDRTLSLVEQDHMLEKLQRRRGDVSPVVDVDADHVPFLKAPEILADLVRAVVDDALETAE